MDEQDEVLIDGLGPTMLVYLPHILISATTVADAVTCLRKAVLSSKVQAAASTNKPTIHLVSGSVVHDVFEQTILQPDRLERLAEVIQGAIKNHLATIHACDETEGNVVSSVQSILSKFPAWCKTYLRDRPLSTALVTNELKASVGSESGAYSSPHICIPQVYSLEESICCPSLGLKGKIDSVVLTRVEHQNRPISLLVPLELKTGRSSSSAAHRAQTLLYTLLLAHRYAVPVPFGLLFYVASNTLLRIAAAPSELQALVMIRNRLAAASQAFSTSSQLPRPISNPINCKQCSQLENCVAMIKLCGPGKGEEDAPLNATLEGHLKLFAEERTSNAFYFKWEQLVRLEEEEATLCRQNIQLDSRKATVVLRECAPAEESNAFGRFLAWFERTEPGDLEFAEGDPVVVLREDEEDEGAAAIGFILDSRPDAPILISCDRDISHMLVPTAGFCPETNHAFGKADCTGSRFVLLRDEPTSGFSLARSNLVQMYTPRNARLRDLLASRRAPRFSADAGIKYNRPRRLDGGQVGAIEHCLCAEDYALILGMPGAGKTTTLVELIRILAERGCNILVASYTHSAVDNLLVRLQDTGVPVLRIGNASRIDRRLQSRIIPSAQHFSSVTALRAVLQTTRVFGTSCLGSNHPLLGTITFDYCIVDEASQISVPVVLGPILQARKFILVGDHFQLPPLVRSTRAIELGLAQSLFKILAEEHPRAVCILTRQYRMCEDIQLLANRTVYQGMLQCGSECVRDAQLLLDPGLIPSCSLCHGGTRRLCWIEAVLEPARRVCFLDTDGIPASHEAPVGNSFENRIEASLIAMLIGVLNGVPLQIASEQMGVISAFRPQVRLLRSLIPNEAIEISTVDRFQGRDKDCIFLSFVRSNPDHTVPSLASYHSTNTNRLEAC